MNTRPQKRAPILTLRRELFRHPYFFLTLLSFIFLGAMSAFLLVLSNVTTYQSQDIRQKAASETAQGITLAFISQGEGKVNQPAMIKVVGRSQGNIDGLELDFTVTGPSGVINALQITPKENQGLARELFTVVDVSGGKRVHVMLLSSSQSAGTPLTPGGTDLLEITFTPTTTGNVFVTLDNARSEGYLFNNTTDELQARQPEAFVIMPATSPNPPVSPSPAPPTSPTPTPSSAENLYFTAANSLDFRKERTNESIKITDIVSGERYTLRHTARIQNSVKNGASTDARSVTVQFRANDSGVTSKNFSMSQLQKADGGIDMVFETSFVGKTNNTFKTTLDTAATVSETNENDNVLTTTYSYEVTTTTVNTATIATVCNKYCANDGECSYGLKCWYNKCRHPDNVQAETCTPPSSVVVGCNTACQSNRDCASGLTCSSNRCRNPKGVTSTTCQSSSTSTVIAQKKSEKTSTTGQKGSAIAAVPSPKATATPAAWLQTPTPTIDTTAPEPTADSGFVAASPTPSEEDDQTALGDILGWVGQLPSMIKNKLSEGDSGWRWLIIGGVVLIAILALLSQLGRHKDTLPPMQPRKPILSSDADKPIQVRSIQHSGPIIPGLSPVLQNPLSTSTSYVRPMQSTPSLMAAPRPLPLVSPPVSASGTTMISRLQDRGVIKPSAASSPTGISGFPSEPSL